MRELHGRAEVVDTPYRSGPGQDPRDRARSANAWVMRTVRIENVRFTGEPGAVSGG
ncbi:hypothetical protein [Streptomyces sp. NBC_01477]|uniref:hypothetical protein n=1 Tax=Streptomyces sp. NBC_01477 TaxID=2976015 RepID=UPI002E343096|nr:hypothetical protein [Streptomyces sp. NBC_01477]